MKKRWINEGKVATLIDLPPRRRMSLAQEQIKEELSIVGEELSMRLATSGEAFASMIDTRSAALLEKSRASTEAMGSLIAAKTENLLQALNTEGKEEHWRNRAAGLILDPWHHVLRHETTQIADGVDGGDAGSPCSNFSSICTKSCCG